MARAVVEVSEDGMGVRRMVAAKVTNNNSLFDTRPAMPVFALWVDISQLINSIYVKLQ